MVYSHGDQLSQESMCIRNQLFVGIINCLEIIEFEQVFFLKNHFE